MAIYRDLADGSPIKVDRTPTPINTEGLLDDLRKFNLSFEFKDDNQNKNKDKDKLNTQGNLQQIDLNTYIIIGVIILVVILLFKKK